MKKRDRIFIGINNVGNVHENLCRSFQLVGLKCDSYIWSTGTNNFYQNDQSYHLFLFNTKVPPFIIFKKNIFHIINKFLRWFHFFKVIFRYNVFMFISLYSFDYNHYSLWILKKLNKKVICLFAGCMERDVNFDKDNPDYICNNCLNINKQKYCLCKNEDLKKRRVRNIENHCNYILAQPDISSYVRDKSKLIWFYLADDYKPDINKLLTKYDQGTIKIVHLPSNKEVKQTHIIAPVLEKLRKTNNVEIIIKEGFWEREKILQTLEEAHILVNSIGTGYNMTAVEAMGRGTIVLNSNPEWFKKLVPEAPIIHITQESLERTILDLLQNKELLKEIVIKSIKYYLKYHSLESVGIYYKNKLKLV